MKKLIIPLFLVLTFLCGCASAKKYEFGFAEGAKTSVKCSMSIPSKYNIKQNYVDGMDSGIVFYTAFDREKNSSGGIDEFGVISVSLSAKTDNSEEDTDFYTTREFSEYLLSTYENITYSEERTVCGYNAFYNEKTYTDESLFGAIGQISIYVSNDKTEEDDFFAISLTGTYRNETEKQEIIDAINSLEIY